jgi:hypothetical protein
MLGPGGNDDGDSIMNVMCFSIQHNLAFTGFKPNKLIQFVDFHPDLLARPQIHQHELAMLSRKQFFSVVLIVNRSVLYVSDEVFHKSSLIGWKQRLRILQTLYGCNSRSRPTIAAAFFQSLEGFARRAELKWKTGRVVVALC